MSDANVTPEALAIIELVAAAVRGELGNEVDAYPGHSSPEQADPINRAFRATVLALLGANPTPGVSGVVSVSRALRRVAERRLAADGFDARRARLLLDGEPGGPDDWLTFLVLSSRTQIEDALSDMGTDLG